MIKSVGATLVAALFHGQAQDHGQTRGLPLHQTIFIPSMGKKHFMDVRV